MLGDALLLLLSAALFSNVVLAQFLGLCPFMGVTRQYDTAVATSLATAFVLALAAALGHLAYHQILTPLNLQWLNVVVYILVIATAVQFTELYVRATSPLLHQVMGVYLPLITTNCAVLGVVLLAEQQTDSLLAAVLFAIGAALGFSLVLAIFAALRERLDHGAVPAPFAGAPIALISAGCLALAFMGFSGMGER